MGLPLLKRNNRLKAYVSFLFTPNLSFTYKENRELFTTTNIQFDGELSMSILESGFGAQYQFAFKNKEIGIYTRAGIVLQSITNYRKNTVSRVSDNPLFSSLDYTSPFINEEHGSVVDGNIFPVFGAGIYFKQWMVGLDFMTGKKFLSLNGSDQTSRPRINVQYFFSTRKS